MYFSNSNFLSISIHAPTRGATCKNYSPQVLKAFQSTLPQGERRRKVAGKIQITPISIHAPTRGATMYRYALANDICISIHAPTRGATVSPCVSTTFLRFQSTLPQGERPVLAIPNGLYTPISIHAPTRGATAIFPNFRPCITLNIPKFYQYHSFFLIICS